jgi:hypothetical protein
MKLERTGWFDAVRVYPVRIGWYEYRILRGPVYRLFWDAKGWKSRQHLPYSMHALPGDQWRGLSKEWKNGSQVDT